MNVQSNPGPDGGAPAPAPAPAASGAPAPAPAGAPNPAPAAGANPAPAAGANPAPADPANPNPAPNPAPAPVAATRPDYIPETLWDAEKGTVKADDLGKILTAHAERQAKLITDPTKVELKTELKNQDGSPVTFNMDSPIMKAAITMAQGRGWTTEDLSAMAEIVATAQIASVESDLAEFKTLGNGDEAKANARLSAAIAKGAAQMGSDEKGQPTAEATQAMTRLFATVHTRADFETLEKLINGQAGPGAAAAGGGGSAPVDMAASWYPNEAKKAG